MRWSPEMVRPAGGTPAVHQTRRTQHRQPVDRGTLARRANSESNPAGRARRPRSTEHAERNIASQWIASLWPARGPLDSMDLLRA